MIKFIKSEINKINGKSWLLDGMILLLFDFVFKISVAGFPRTLSQAESLWEIEKIDLALNLVVPYQIIIDRVKGRWVHLPSGRVYNEGFNSPKIPVSFYVITHLSAFVINIQVFILPNPRQMLNDYSLIFSHKEDTCITWNR